MKYLRKIILSTAIGATLLTGCNRDELTDLNINPQSQNTIDLNFLFSSAQLGAASGGSRGDNRYIDWRTNIRMCAYAIQHLATTGGDPGDKYTDDAETSSAPFEFIYADQLKNLTEILKQSDVGGFAEGKNANLRQATRILRAFLFHRLTDYYGRIPYFEALQADKGVFFPKYDSQKDIYTDLLKELDEATASFGAEDPADGFEGADLYYNGNIDQWKRWGYSLMLRLAMRVSNVAPDMANTYVQKAVAGGVFQSNDDNVIVPMAVAPSLWVNQNGISRAFYPGDGGQSTIMSKTLIDFLKGANPGVAVDDDPRLMILTGGIGIWRALPDGTAAWEPTKTNPVDQKGMPNGLTQSQLEAFEGQGTIDQHATYSKINPKLLDRDEPYMLMNYGEVQLLLAEAAERGIGGLTAAAAQGYYNEGVKASMQMYTLYDASFDVSDAEVATYLATYPYGSSNKLEMIHEQLWVNHFLNWWEAWSDYRRTKLPALVPTNAPGNVTGGKIPERLRYPNAEAAGNPNFDAGASPNNYTTPVWWAGGPE